MTTCPEHPEVELRIEWGSGDRTGFCVKCPMHHPMCIGVNYMAMCERTRDHEGPHRDVRGSEFTNDSPGYMGPR